jgi:hypothetical protein
MPMTKKDLSGVLGREMNLGSDPMPSFVQTFDVIALQSAAIQIKAFHPVSLLKLFPI